MKHCPHGAGAPATCSQCLQAKPRLVDQQGADITIDGEVVRRIQTPMTDAQLKYARRGGKRK